MEGMASIDVKADYFIADALYGMSKKFIRMAKEKAKTVIMPIKNGLHNKIRDKLRKEVAKAYRENERIYRKRYVVEQVIGKVKTCFGDFERTKDLEMAKKMVLLKFIMYNYGILRDLTEGRDKKARTKHFFALAEIFRLMVWGLFLKIAFRNFRTPSTVLDFRLEFN